MATSQSYQRDLKNNWHTKLDYLHLDYAHRETLHKWVRMPECDEFVGAKRSKHTMVAYKHAIYIFGGDDGKQMLNDLLRFDVKDKSWSRAFTNNSQISPAPRYHHSAVVHNTSMFIFGGYTGDIHSNSNLTNKNDLYEYNIKIGQWIKWMFTGKAPVPRSAHGAAVFDDKLWIFAGYDGNARLNDMWTISLKNRAASDSNNEVCCGTWEQVNQLGECPPTCCNFPVAVARDCMFVFSGQSGAKITNSLFQFHFASRFWTRISTDHILRAVPPSPTRRYGHTMVAYDRHLYVFGGAADHTLPNDLHYYDLDTNTWSIVKITGDSHVPSGRLFHASAVVDGAMYIYGGTVDNNVRSGEIYRFKFSNYPRCTLHDDYGRLLASKQCIDVEFIIGEEKKVIPGHIAIIAARSFWLRERIREATIERERNKKQDDNSILQVRLLDAVPDAFEMILNYIYSDQIDPTRKIRNPPGNKIVLLMMDVYRLAKQFQMSTLEQLCIQYLETTINLQNVLEALQYSSSLELYLIKNLCLKFIVKEGNYKEIVMSSEFEILDKPLMVEIVREKLEPSVRACDRPPLYQCHTLEKDMATFLKQHLFCDITLTLDDTKIPVHKSILVARSGYFEALFRSFKPKEDEIRVQIDEIVPSHQAFDSLLRYIYYGDVMMSPEDSIYLYAASHFYSFNNNRLQAFCKENLEMNVSPQNVLKILDAANSTNMVEMKAHALDMIVEHFPQVALQPNIRLLGREVLLEILDAVARQMNNLKKQGETTSKNYKTSIQKVNNNPA